LSNTSKGAAEHDYGSKYWIQKIVNDSELCKQLNRAISGQEKLRWVSPLKFDDYAEYKLNQEIVLDNIGIIDKDVSREVFSFWPVQQPQWDGIAVSNDNMDYYLIEAKAHTEEVRTKMSTTKDGASEKAKENEALIISSMKAAFDVLADGGDFENWKSKYYQLGNRLTFMHYLNNCKFLEKKRFHIVLLNFANDKHFKNTAQMWEEDYSRIWNEMLGKARIPDRVKVITWDVR